MIPVYLLQHLNAFARLGRLSAAFQKLHISQPALTRSMQKPEQKPGASLFIWNRNRMQMNDNGRHNPKYTAGYISILHKD